MPYYIINAKPRPKDVQEWSQGKSVRLYFSPNSKLIVNKSMKERAEKAMSQGRKFFRSKMSKMLIKKNISSGTGFWSDFVKGFKMPFEFTWNKVVRPGIDFVGKDILKPIISEAKDILGENREAANIGLDLLSLVKPEAKQGADIAKRVIEMVPKKGSGIYPTGMVVNRGRGMKKVKKVAVKRTKKTLPPALKAWRDRVNEYRLKNGVSLKQAMIALSSKNKKLGKGIIPV